MHIEFGDYRIRDWDHDDAQALVQYANNRMVSRWLRDGFPYPYTWSDAKTFLSVVTVQEVRTTFALATAQEAIGGIGLEFGEDIHRFTAELGYWLAEPFWGRGIMTEAVHVFTAWAFENFEVHRIHARPFVTNAASARVLEKAGFQREGRLRANVFKSGEILDQFLYARVRDGIA